MRRQPRELRLTDEDRKPMISYLLLTVAVLGAAVLAVLYTIVVLL
jgi:hypothetical protein